MRTCTTCGRPVDADTCPWCAHAAQSSSNEALLLPPGPLGAIAAAAIAVLVFGGVWGLFTWLTPDVPLAAATPSPAPVAAPASPLPTPSPDVLPSPAPAPVVATDDPVEVDWDAVGVQVGRSVVQVRADRCGTPGPAGAGFLVAGDRLLTAAHLVADASSIRVRQGGVSRRAFLLAMDESADVALVTLGSPLDGPGLSVVPRLVDVGDELAVVARTDRDDAGSARPGIANALDLQVQTRAGQLDDVLTLRQPTDGVPPGAVVVTADGHLAGMALVDHVRQTSADTTHVVSGETVADLVATWAGARAPARRTCPTPTPTPTPAAPTPSATPTPDQVPPSPTAPPPAPPPPTAPPTAPPTEPDPFVPDDATWIAVLETHPVDDADRADMARRMARLDRRLQLPRQGVRTQLLRTDDWSSLQPPGSWFLYLGEWGTANDATSACLAIRVLVPDCVTAPLVP